MLGWPRAKGPRGILKEEKQGQMVEYFSPCPHGVWTFYRAVCHGSDEEE